MKRLLMTIIVLTFCGVPISSTSEEIMEQTPDHQGNGFMSSREILNALSGTTWSALRLSDSSVLFLHFYPSGAMEVKFSSGYQETGHWEVTEPNKFCYTFQERTCRGLKKKKNEIHTFSYDSGKKAGVWTFVNQFAQ